MRLRSALRSRRVDGLAIPESYRECNRLLFPKKIYQRRIRTLPAAFIGKREDALFLGLAILRHSAPPCYVRDIKEHLVVGFRPTDRHPSDQPAVSSLISANIDIDGPLATGRLRGRRFARATSRTTSTDSIASNGISQGAQGTTWVAGILFDSISRRMTLWLMPSRSDACSSVTVSPGTNAPVQAGGRTTIRSESHP